MKPAAWPLLVLVAFVTACASCAATPPPPAPVAQQPTPAASVGTSAPSPTASASGGTTAPPPTSPATLATPATASTDADPLVGKPAPDFTSTAQDGTPVHLAALRAKTVIVYFYPQDETPGCTKEACSFRDAWDAIAKQGATLVGISADAAESHKSFAGHYKLPFLLLSDPQGAIGQSYGVPFHGHHQRQTFVIGPDGRVRKVYRTVDVGVHANQILGDLTYPA